MNPNAPGDQFLADGDSPQIYDTDMTDTPQGFNDFFFDQAYANEAPLYGENGYPAASFPSAMPPKTQPMPNTVRRPPNDQVLSTSSESQDSSSDSSERHQRQSSSRSSHSFDPARGPRSGSAPNKVNMYGGPRNAFAPTQGMDFGFVGGRHTDNLEFDNRVMEAAFDFDSAANTPSPLTSASSVATSGPGTRFVAIPQDSPMATNSMLQPPTGSSMGSRENSPLQMHAHYPPAAMQTSHTSPASSDDFLEMPNVKQKMPSFSAGQQMQGMFAAPMAVTRPPPAMSSRMGGFPKSLPGAHKTPSQLIIHPTPPKSRVETQIPIKMSLFPLPQGVKKLHLPHHTISKPKLLAKPRPKKQPDTLELSVSLVCTSAMRDPVKLKRALDRAEEGKSDTVKMEDGRRSSSDNAKSPSDSEDDPLNGGEVHICKGCINRERKRAARKKCRKPEEEEAWQKDEAKRVVVFNTNEIREWSEPHTSNGGGDNPSDEGGAIRDASPLHVPEGAKMIEVPMRIACYCRHRSEKMGFQVIFTVKDWQGTLIAQSMTNPIMITDDHKTHAPPAGPHSNGILFEQIALPNGSLIAQEPLDNYATGLHRNAHSTNDLQALQNQFSAPFGQRMSAPFAVPQAPSHSTSTTMTPRNLSRQASPTSSSGANKKRKGSAGPIRLPDNLQMTRMSGSGPSTSASQNWPTSSGLPISPNSVSPYVSSFPGSASQLPVSQQSNQYYTSPASSNNDSDLFGQMNHSQSFENLQQMQGVYSLPGSNRQSRTGSPTANTQAINTMATSPDGSLAVNAMHNMFAANNLSSPSRTPVIHKLIPSEGPKAGGIEVTCLGSGFTNGLEIMFGNCLATTTTFWGETSLVCLLPPSQTAGLVPVTFKPQNMQQMTRIGSQAVPRPTVMFKYIDDDEQELLRQAMLVLGNKMYGSVREVSDIARSIVNGSGGLGGSGSMDGGNVHMGSQRPNGQFDAESAVLRVLEMIDLDDSPYQARLNMRRKNGQALLHRAASLGFARLVAGLLARGANPDVRDANGLSPMHMAAINGHAGIVQRLRRAGGDPWLRSLRGYTPADMATNAQVLEAARILCHTHSHSRGVSLAGRSRSSSFSSTMSRRRVLIDESSYEYDYSDESDDEASVAPRASRHGTPAQAWARSRQNSVEGDIIEPALGVSFPAAAMTAWRDSLASQIQQFQQSVSWNFPNLPNLPNLQLPNIPSMPTIPENYQAGSMVRRFSSLVPQRSLSPSDSDGSGEIKEAGLSMWDRLTGSSSSSPAPPAYDEIYPDNTEQDDMDTKTASATRAAVDAAADIKCSTLFDEQVITETAESSSSQAASKTRAKTLRIDSVEVTEEERAALLAAKEQRMKQLRSDRKLFFVWIPILVFVILAVLKNQVPPMLHLIKDASVKLAAMIAPNMNAAGQVVELQ